MITYIISYIIVIFPIDLLFYNQEQALCLWTSPTSVYRTDLNYSINFIYLCLQNWSNYVYKP